MTKEKGEKIRSIYGISLAVFSILVGVLFIVQTWRIYRSAEQSPYTTEIISKMFKQIAIPVYLWIAAAIGGGVIACVFPEEKKRPKAYISLLTSLKRTEKRLPTSEEFIPQITSVKTKEEKLRKWISVACVSIAFVLLFVCFAVLFDLFYLPIMSRPFFVAHNGLVDRLFQIALLLIIGLRAIGCGEIFMDNSRQRQQKYYLEILASAKGQPKGEPVPTTQSKCKKLWEKLNFWSKLPKEKQKKTVFGLRIALGVIGIAFVAWGIVNGGMKDVLLKAINICTQCIGLG